MTAPGLDEDAVLACADLVARTGGASNRGAKREPPSQTPRSDVTDLTQYRATRTPGKRPARTARRSP